MTVAPPVTPWLANLGFAATEAQTNKSSPEVLVRPFWSKKKHIGNTTQTRQNQAAKSPCLELFSSKQPNTDRPGSSSSAERATNDRPNGQSNNPQATRPGRALSRQSRGFEGISVVSCSLFGSFNVFYDVCFYWFPFSTPQFLLVVFFFAMLFFGLFDGFPRGVLLFGLCCFFLASPNKEILYKASCMLLPVNIISSTLLSSDLH